MSPLGTSIKAGQYCLWRNACAATNLCSNATDVISLPRTHFRAECSVDMAAFPPDGWKFGTGAAGKPYLVGQSKLQFNIAHTRGLVARFR